VIALVALASVMKAGRAELAGARSAKPPATTLVRTPPIPVFLATEMDAANVEDASVT